MLRRIWSILVKLVKSLFESAPDPREREMVARNRHEGLLTRITDTRQRVQTVREQLEHATASSRRETVSLLDEARLLVETGDEGTARMVLYRRQAVLDRIRSLEGQLARIMREGQMLASVGDMLESEIAIRSAHHHVSDARYDAAVMRATVTEALAGVSDEFSDLLTELSAANERAEFMESRADALDELVEIGVLSSCAPLPQVGIEPHYEEVEALLEQMRGGEGQRS